MRRGEKSEVRNPRSEVQGCERGKQLGDVRRSVRGSEGQPQASLAARDRGVADGWDENALVAERRRRRNSLLFAAEQNGNDSAAGG